MYILDDDLVMLVLFGADVMGDEEIVCGESEIRKLQLLVART